MHARLDDLVIAPYVTSDDLSGARRRQDVRRSSAMPRWVSPPVAQVLPKLRA